jgi:ubiquinone/menaquinone biosynthesis C-methylase UbiE
MQLPDRSFHFVVSIGPREYGFRNQFTAFELLKEVFRVLKAGGELHVFGNYENPWFNMDMNSTEGQKRFRTVSRTAGFRVIARLQPIAKHPWYGLFRDEQRIITINCRGKMLKSPTHFHLLKKKA